MSLSAPYSLVSGSDQSTVEHSENHLQSVTTSAVTAAAQGPRKADESEMDYAGQISAVNTTSANLYIPPNTTAAKKDSNEPESYNAPSNHTTDSRNSTGDRSSLPSLNLRGDSTGASDKPQKGILKKPSVSHSESGGDDGAPTVQRSSKVASFSLDTESTTAETQRQGYSSDSSDDYNHTSGFKLEPLKSSMRDNHDGDKQLLIELDEIDHEGVDRGGSSHPAASSYGYDGHRPPPSQRTLKKLQSRLNLNELAQNELELKTTLFYHIGNPIKRWRVEKVIPGKLIVQLLKTFCLIVQVVLYTNTFPRQRAEFFYESREVFENLFFKDFKSENPRDFYSAFNAEEILLQFDYVTQRYCQLPDITIGGYDFAYDENGHIIPATITLQQYATATFNTSSKTYILNGTIVTKMFNVFCGENATNASTLYTSESNDRLFNRFVELVISFPIKNMRVIHPERVECYTFQISVHFRLEDNSGKVVYNLQERHEHFNCQGEVLTPKKTFSTIYGALTMLDVIVLSLCFLSICQTCLSLQRAFKLYRAMGTFYKQQLHITLTCWDRSTLFPIWHPINTISDLLIIIGSLSKILLDFFVFDDSAPVRVLLGTAVIFQAVVMLRYISYFKQLNALTRTMRLAFPELLKFLLCSGLLFMAFALAGWVVLGPFHSKFDNINSAIETLFGLLNGDDIYNTFTQIRSQDDHTAYVYSRIFLYVFLALFIYAVLNLFTSLIISAYEASQEWDTATRNEVRRFVFSGPLTPNGVALRDFGLTKKYVDPKVIKEKKRRSLKKRISCKLRSRGESLLVEAEH